MTVRSFTVRGMTCGHCASSVRAEIEIIPGVVDVNVDAASGRVHVTASQAVRESQVREAVEEAGFELVPTAEADAGNLAERSELRWTWPITTPATAANVAAGYASAVTASEAGFPSRTVVRATIRGGARITAAVRRLAVRTTCPPSPLAADEGVQMNALTMRGWTSPALAVAMRQCTGFDGASPPAHLL